MRNLFVITGATAVGEDSIIDALGLRRQFSKIITSTTRSMREHESPGSPYYFVSREVFEKDIADGAMVEYATGTNDELYGVTRSEFTRHAESPLPVIWKVDFKGAMTARELFPECTIIHITVPSPDVIRARLLKRDAGSSQTYIDERLAYAKNWDLHPELYDFTVVNSDGELDASVDTVDQIISSRMASE